MKKTFVKSIFLLLISLICVLGGKYLYNRLYSETSVSNNLSYKKSKEFPYYKSDLEKMNLKGNIKSFSEFSFKTIDSFGKISKGERQHEDGFDYYRNRFPPGGHSTFNKSGGLIETLEYDLNDKVKEKIIFTYNENGNIIEENVYDNNDKFDYKVVFKYDDKGYLIDRSLYNKDGKVNSKFVYENNKKDNQINKSMYFDGKLDSTEDSKYDNNGNVIQTNSVTYGKYFNQNTFYFQYDNQGYLIEESSNTTLKDGSSVDMITNYNYNEYGDKTERWFSPSTNDKWTFEYEYDSQKNWIKRIQFFRGVPEFIIERKIEYYN